MQKNTNRQSGYYAILPANVRYDKSLNAQCKLLYAEITALTRSDGYCWAKNGYFAELFGVDEVTVSRWLKKLSDKKYISIERSRRKDGTYKTRKIYIVDSSQPSDDEFPDEDPGDQDTAECENDHIAKMQSGDVIADESHIAELQSGQNSPENAHIAKMQSGQNHIAKMQDIHIANLQGNNNISLKGLTSKRDNDDDVKNVDITQHPRARSRPTVTVEQFEDALQCWNWGRLPNGDNYERVRDVLIELINDGFVVLEELTRDDLENYVAAMYKGRKRRRITNLRAYLLSAVKNTRKSVRRDLARELEDQDEAVTLVTHFSVNSDCINTNLPVSQVYENIELAQEIWCEMRNRLEYEINSLSFDVWFKDVLAVGFNKGSLILQCPTAGARDEILKKYRNTLRHIYAHTITAKEFKLCV